MANYCSNAVHFTGSEKDVEAVQRLFEAIRQKQADSDRYHMPDFVTAEDGYMSDIENNHDWILYETRWVPNLDVLVQIAARYNVDFIATYHEPMEGHYGEAVYTAGELHLAHLNVHLEDKNTHTGLQHVRQLQAVLLNGPQHKR